MICLFTLYFMLLGLWGNGCSSGRDNPVIPQENQSSETMPAAVNVINDIPVAYSDNLPDGGMTGTGILGAFNVHIDIEKLSGELSSFRSSSAIGDSFIVDITSFLTVLPCFDCLKLEAISLNEEGNLVLSFSIKHPFKPGNLANPPSAANRLDLHIFDVFGVMHFTGMGEDYTSLGLSTSKTNLIDADGYSSTFDSKIDTFFPTEASLHPYKVMSLDTSTGNFNPNSPTGFTDPTAPSGHNVLPMGSNPVRTDFELDFGDASESLDFTLVLTAAYGQSATKLTRLMPTYYLPEFNRKEAWKVQTTILANNLFQPDSNTYCDVRVRIWDWNHSATVNPALTSKDQIKAPSTPSSVQIFIPDVTTVPVAAAGPLSGNGTTDPLRFEARVYNTAKAGFGTKQGLVKVTDSRIPGMNTGGLGDGVDRNSVFFNIPEFATYQIFSVDVEKPIPTAVITTDPRPPVVNPMEFVHIDGTSSYDYDGNVTSYEWDFNYNGTTFDVDSTVADPLLPLVLDNNNNFENRLVTIALRVTDDNSPTPYTDLTTEIITILPNRSPVADFEMSTYDAIRRGESIDFDASGSSDPDGDIITAYDWDFDYQNGQFDVDATGAVTSHQFNKFGNLTVALRVADQGQPDPRHNIKTENVFVIPVFDPSQEIDGVLTPVELPHAMNSCVVATDPNSDDVYVAYSASGNIASVCYPPYTTGDRIKVHRSNDGGTTWSAAFTANCSPCATGNWGFAMCVVPGVPTGTLWLFWIGEGGNSSSHTADANNIRFSCGNPDSGNGINWCNLNWLDDITKWSLSQNPETMYRSDYYAYSDPTDIAVVADPISQGAVYLSYIEEAATMGRSVRLLKCSDIDAYPSSTWTPMTKTTHIDTATTNNFDSLEMAMDSTRNLYIVYDDNDQNQIEMKRLPYAQVPGDPIRVIDTATSNAYLYRPRIALDKNENPVIVYNHTRFTGGVNDIPDIVMNTWDQSTQTVGTPILVNDNYLRNLAKQEPDLCVDPASGMIFVTWDDRRLGSSYGEIYWTVFDENFNKLISDEKVNPGGTPTINDFDVHMNISTGPGGPNLVTIWEQYSEDIWIGHGY